MEMRQEKTERGRQGIEWETPQTCQHKKRGKTVV